MTEPAPPPAGRHRARPAAPGASDAALLTAVRAGETAAYGELYRRHSPAARQLARLLVPDSNDAEDLVAEAFARVLAALRAGNGPQVAFRAYLLTAVRHACYDRARRYRRLELTADLTRYEKQPPDRDGGDPAVARLDRSYAARAFARLPERLRTVLWHTEVEGRKPARVAPLLGLTPNAVATLARRGRERLRQMYLQEHLTVTGAPSCRWTADRLGAYVRRGLSRRERSKVDAHLAACRACRTLWMELTEVNAAMRGVLVRARHRLGGLVQPPGGLVRRLSQQHGPGTTSTTSTTSTTGIAAVAVAVAVIGVSLFALAAATDPTWSTGRFESVVITIAAEAPR